MSLRCGLQVAANDDDVLIERSEYDDDDVLIKISECDDDDILIKRSECDDDDVLIEISECDGDDVLFKSLKYDDDVADWKIRIWWWWCFSDQKIKICWWWWCSLIEILEYNDDVVADNDDVLWSKD